MSGHIRIDKDLADDPRVWRIADELLAHLQTLSPTPLPDVTRNALLGVTRNAALGALTKLWRYADHYISIDDALPTALHELAEVVQLPVPVLQKFPREWLVETPDGRVRLPDYTAKNALNAKEKRRAQSRERVRRWREKKAQEEAAAAARAAAQKAESSNALPTVTSNACNAPSRVRARAGIPETETVPSEEKPPTPLKGGNGVLAHSRRKPRELRDQSAELWGAVVSAVDRVKGTERTWADARAEIADDLAHQTIEELGGYKPIADRTQFNQGELKRRFRELYEQRIAGDESRASA